GDVLRRSAGRPAGAARGPRAAGHPRGQRARPDRPRPGVEPDHGLVPAGVHVNRPAGLPEVAGSVIIPLLLRGGAVWQLVGLITRRSQVQILPPLPPRARVSMKAPLEPFSFCERRARRASVVGMPAPNPASSD